MPGLLSVYINDTRIIEYDKSSRLPGKQRQFLDGMDLDMDDGIKLDDKIITSPDNMQRAKYVAMSILFGVHTSNESIVSAGCAYLANRLPELEQVRAIEQGDEITLDLVFKESG